MAAKWEHPEWGQFEFEKPYGWERTILVPVAFNIFTYYTSYRSISPPETIEFSLETANNDDLPSTSAIALASSVLRNQEGLAAAVISALWEDFNGRGPDSGMWWHGDLVNVIDWGMKWQIHEKSLGMIVKELPLLIEPGSIPSWMRLFRIAIRNRIVGYERPIAELCFDAAFEPEHNVGILTDGDVILGIGYNFDVQLFRIK